MRAALLLAPVLLSLVLLGAHFLRGGGVWLALAVVGLAVLVLAVQRRWVARLTQVVLLVGGLEWVSTLRSLARARVAAGEPVARLVAILGTVAAVALASAMVFETETLGRSFGLSDARPDEPHPDAED